MRERSRPPTALPRGRALQLAPGLPRGRTRPIFPAWRNHRNPPRAPPSSGRDSALSPRAPRSKASKPELKPLDEHLAALLNPGIAREAAKTARSAPASPSRPRPATTPTTSRASTPPWPASSGSISRPKAKAPASLATAAPPRAPASRDGRAAPRRRPRRRVPEGEIRPGDRKRDVGLSREDILKAAPKRVRQGNVLRDEDDDDQVRGNGLIGATATMDSLKAPAGAGRPEPARDEALDAASAAAPGQVRRRHRASSWCPIRAQGRPAHRHRGAGRRREAPRARPGAARRHRLGQDLHHGAGHRGAPTGRR